MLAQEVKPFKHIKKAYIEMIGSQFVNEAAFNFYFGCKFMQMEIYVFNSDEVDTLEINEDSIFYGGVDTMLRIFNRMGIQAFNPLDIPEELNSYAGRKIYMSTIDAVAESNYITYPIFIKPADIGKLFNGSIVGSQSEMKTFQVYNKTEGRDIPIMVSEVVNFLSEFRAFVLNGEILDCRKYLGDYRKHPDYKIIENAIKDYSTSPVAYAMDFGVTDKGETLLIEVNDAHSLGTYGLDSYQYLRMIMMRWLEITNPIFNTIKQ